MPVLALVGNKGGAGKTTLCVNLASALKQRAPTIVLDCDPQKSSLQWFDLSEDQNAVTVVDAVEDLPASLEQVRAEYSHIVIDCPPSVHSEQTAQALAATDIALIPVQPSPLDLWASVHIEEKIDAARAQNPALKVFLVINQLEPHTKLSQIMDQALAELSLPATSAAIRRRMIYRRAFLEGKSVQNMGSRGAEAAAEIEALIEEVLHD